MKKERRVISTDLKVQRRGDQDLPTLVGYAAKFDKVANIGGMFNEVIRRGAFAKTVEDGDDVRALHNHDANIVLGRTGPGTLRLKEDDVGLRVEIDPPDTQQAHDLIVSMERGDIDQMSFAFTVDSEKWNRATDEEPELRELLAVRLFDVSSVTFPAYSDTSIGVRSAEEVFNDHHAENSHEADDGAEVELGGHEADHRTRLVEIERAS